MLIQLLIDFGLVILIWMTQLIVYPSFTKMNMDDLLQWHPIYSKRISFLVIPLMLGQFGLHSYAVVQSLDIWHITTLVLVISAWMNTFLYAVPLHNQIAKGVDIKKATKKLVSVNWWRTVFWSLVFLINLYQYLYRA